MIAELGQLALASALGMAILQALLPLAGIPLRRPAWLAAAGPLTQAQFVLLAAALLLLAILFVRHDFSVAYVANNSNTALPLVYRLAAIWGGHEGSLLLWVFMLAGWSAAFATWARTLPATLRARVLAVLGLVSTAFLLFTLTLSSPFARLALVPSEGRDLNPLLQDPGLIIHPPMLYMGYVGFAIAFAFAIAALMAGQMDSAWARWARPWTLLAWLFLTVGITLGSWWAYYELGWGGWWFWDPVENASFMPWLAGTALLHSLAATQARGLFKSWTCLLAILTFSLCLLGTFLVRSGILVSVHSFAADPSRGLFILVLLGLLVGGALVLYAQRTPLLAKGARFSLIARESGILMNSIFLTIAAFSILLGTLYPLFLEALGGGKISVGAPYFSLVFVPLAVVPAALCVPGSISHWKSDRLGRVARSLSWPFVGALVIGGLLPKIAEGAYQWSAAGGLSLASWIILGSLRAVHDRIVVAKRPPNGRFWGMITAHTGLAVFIAGATLASCYDQELDVRLAPGESHLFGGYNFTLEGLREEQGANFDAIVALVRVSKNGVKVAELHPAKRSYFANPANAMTEAGIHAGLGGDLYIALGEALGAGSWSLRLQIKPFIRLIWGGALLMAAGALLVVCTRRRPLSSPC